MLDNLATTIAHMVTRIVEITGIAIIALGAFVTLFVFLYRRASGANQERAIAEVRSSLGRAILLGLEFLVAADIINTVAVQPTLKSIAVLAGIVAIRTFLSFSLETEILGRLPWQRGKQQQSSAPDAVRR